jgi:hypothetical protein
MEMGKVTYVPASKRIVWHACLDLYRNDELLADSRIDYFSLNPKLQGASFELFSDRFVRMWPTYRYDEKLIIRPTAATPTINFNTLKRLLLSPCNEDNLSEYSKIVSDVPKFLDRQVDMEGNRIAFASFPRSGNSFLRKMIE